MLESLLLGSSGRYQVLGTTVRFTKRPHKDSYFGSLSEGRLMTQFAVRCMGSCVLRILSLGYVHIFVHEMSHAAMYRIVTGRATNVKIHTKSCEGTTTYKKILRKSSKWQRTAVDLTGPMGNIAFCIGKLALANFLIGRRLKPIAYVLRGGAYVWILGELFYAYVSVAEKDHGDFGRIVKRGKVHLWVASALLVMEIAFGLFLVSNFERSRSCKISGR